MPNSSPVPLKNGIVADAPVAARRARRQNAVFVMQRDRKPVDLEFGDIIKFAPVRQFAAALVERLQIVEIVRIIERHQRHAVDERLKALGAPADPLRRRIGRNEFGIFRFEPL